MDNQGKIWYGKFGTDQMYRNLHKDFESWNNYYKERFGKTKLELNNLFLKKINRKIRILEIGCNVGYQLNCLNKMGFKNLYGIELQSLCIKNLKKKFKFINLVQGDGNNIPFKKNFFDLVFTSNVLIHIHPSNISHFMSEMYRVTSKWIWCFEYYSKKYENVNYRNHKNLLWKTDFSKKFISTFTDLKIQKEILFKSLISNKEIDSMFLLKKNKKMRKGKQMYNWIVDLFPICRSISGKGLYQTLKYIKKIIPSLRICSVKSGTKVFDWKVPQEWNIKDAYVKDEKNKKIIDFKNNNLHLVSYSEPVSRKMSFSELEKHLHTEPKIPNAIPYVTSYYKKNWGFSLSWNEMKKLKKKKGNYYVKIDSKFTNGKFNYGEIIIPGKKKNEIFFSTYICHPSMANNELSGTALLISLIQYVLLNKKRNLTYRFVFIPETIGSIIYLFKNLNKLKRNVLAGFNATCVGDNKTFSFLPSKYGNTIADKLAKNILEYNTTKKKYYSFLDRGSDERQYCSPGINLPMVSIMRSKYGTYREYHTSLDNLNFVSEEGLEGSYEIHKKCIDVLEKNKKYKSTTTCEPHLSSRNLYHEISNINFYKKNKGQIKTILDFIIYADGTNDIIDIANILKISAHKLIPIIDLLILKKLIK